MSKVLQTSVIITKAREKNAIQIRTTTTDPELIKQIIEGAWKEKPIHILPVFRDKIRAIGKLGKEKIIGRDEEGNYKFLI